MWRFRSLPGNSTHIRKCLVAVYMSCHGTCDDTAQEEPNHSSTCKKHHDPLELLIHALLLIADRGFFYMLSISLTDGFDL
jgi:hypothetical protein